MKILILSMIALSSLNAFSAEVGEDQKSQCIYANQASSREPKVIKEYDAEKPKDIKTSISH